MIRMLSLALVFALARCTSTGADASTDADRDVYRGLDPARFSEVIDGDSVGLYWIKADSIEVAFTNYGGRVVGLWVPDETGRMTDVVVGMGSAQGFVTSTEPYFGATIGRVGNRIANGTFGLDGKTYSTPTNDSLHTLHGGGRGFERVVWDVAQPDARTIVFRHVSPEGDQGFPGALDVTVTYRVDDGRQLSIDYLATTDAPTPVNLTNHAFFNLNGEGSGTILGHTLQVAADRYTPVDATLIPRGDLAPVRGTPFDFTTPRTIGERIDADDEQLRFGKGYDHNFVLNEDVIGGQQAVATVTGDQSGIVMKVYTEEPGLQFYSGNFMKGQNAFKSGAKDDHRTAFALETQHFPDAINQEGFGDIVLRPGERYETRSRYGFGVVDR